MIINLILLGRKWDTGGDLYIASLSEDAVVLPFTKIKNGLDPEQETRKLFKKHVDLSPNWVGLKLMSCKIVSGIYNVVYSSEIPIDSKTNLKWVSVNKVDQQHDFSPEIIESIRT